ncbi:MAG: hypothetical protein F4029_07190 [Gammaproteobacteria bacterium]|nr:hypothetical protein [Gammaproteobacteria bacterium]MYK45996.1 hypothetical protein [Gammaproteobacteria bacterium]
MPERTPYQTIEERLASVETKTDRLVQEVDAARIDNQAAFKDLRSLIAKNDAAMRADTQEMESRLRAEIKGTEDELRAEIKGTEDELRAEINRSEDRLRDHMNTTTSTLLSHIRLVVAIMVPTSLGVLGLLAKVIFDST